MPAAIDVPRLIEALNADEEAFPHEKRIAAITFGACLHFPEQHWQILRARTFAACAVIRALHRRKISPSAVGVDGDVRDLAERFLQPVQVTELLLDHDADEHLSFNLTYDGNYPDLATAEAVAFFLLVSPRTLKPSLNKAVFFLERDGFGSKARRGAFKYEKVGRTTTKNAWARYGSVSCFLLAQALTKVEFDLLAPDSPNVVALTDKLICNPGFRRFFPTAGALQAELQTKLAVGAKGHPIWTVPKSVGTVDLALPVLTENQLSIIRDYQAPAPY